jgi:GT2 family glycosyltransferase/spore maturation protein CgeB
MGTFKIKISNKSQEYLKTEKRNFLSPEEIRIKSQQIREKNASTLKLYDYDKNSPLVSIIILNKNGIKHLKRLFKNFNENLQYPNYEIIIVDNGSDDDSIKFLEKISSDLPLTIIKNDFNKSFSEANNEASRQAKGEYLLFLNNDVEPLYGWLNNLMQVALSLDRVGAVGAKLVYPDCSASVNHKNSFKIQHTGIAFRIDRDGFIKPYNRGQGKEVNFEYNLANEVAAVTAATLLVKKEIFSEFDGFDDGYIYGYEDVDFCLKLLKAGYKNYCSNAILFHYEFGTQEKNKKNTIKKRRIQNRKLFSQKWERWLYKSVLYDKIKNNQLFSDKNLKIGFIVTEIGQNASAGDYFTALELAESLNKLGYITCFFSRKGSGNWYYIDEDVDILISLLDAYDPRKIRSSNKFLIKIAWPRNWFERWVSNPGLSDYNIILTASKTAKQYIEEKTGLKSIVYPIATNKERFFLKIPKNNKYASDYCFTGSYWKDPRDIIKFLEPDELPYNFKLFGKNWEEVSKFQKYNEGFINYSKIPEIYASTKIVIDDANRVTKDFGSVNSRVYDALAAGALVITNGEIGSKETFKGKLPYFKSKNELNDLIKHYMSHENLRLSKLKELQDFVLENHTYDNRAMKLVDTLEKYLLKTRIAIKIPAPEWKTVTEWGDFHLAICLKKEFERNGCEVLIQILPEWNNDNDWSCDVILVLRGLSEYKPKKGSINLMWNISHPDKVVIDEYNSFDHVFIASDSYSEEVRKIVNVPVDTMLQCTDPQLFYPDESEQFKSELLFVGNSRKVFRKIIKDLIPTSKDLAVYGTNWGKFIDKKYIKGEYIPYSKLRLAYSSCEILLNDHWDDMRDKGFISNRLFDGFAAGAFIISDDVHGAEIFKDGLITYKTKEELNNLIESYLADSKRRMEKVQIARNIVIKNHTFKNRVDQFLDRIKEKKSEILYTNV